MKNASVQTKQDREEMIKNLPEGVRRVYVTDITGRRVYKRPEEIDLESDYIELNTSGAPIVMMGAPGKQPKVRLPPVTPQIGAVQQARDQHIASDRLLHTTRKGAEADEVYEGIMKAMAEEAAALEFEREETSRNGGDTTSVSAKRAKVLKSMADAWINKKRSTRAEGINIDSEEFSVIFSHILETMKDAMVDAGTRREHIETIFSKFSAAISQPSWKMEAKRKMKGN